MSKGNSPTYAKGREDGMADAIAISECPPRQPVGPSPPFPAYPVMYMRGYNEMYATARPHTCTPACQRVA